jgi:hypothetical protein
MKKLLIRTACFLLTLTSFLQAQVPQLICGSVKKQILDCGKGLQPYSFTIRPLRVGSLAHPERSQILGLFHVLTLP